MFAAYTEFSSLPWRADAEPKVKEFVYIAFDTPRPTCTPRA